MKERDTNIHHSSVVSGDEENINIEIIEEVRDGGVGVGVDGGSPGHLDFALVRSRLDSIGDMTSTMHHTEEMQECEDTYIKSNSPVSMSPCSSISDLKEYCIDTGGDLGEPVDITIDEKFRDKSKKIAASPEAGRPQRGPVVADKTAPQYASYEEIEKSISKYYNNENSYYNELDILITYLRGQKNVYIQAKNITQYKLNMLIVPSLILTTGITIFSPMIYENGAGFRWGGIIISIMNALATLFISFANYFKYESSSETYMNIAGQFDKLETSIELASNKLYFMGRGANQAELVLNKVKHIETKLNEMKEGMNMLVPEYVKTLFPIITHVNIFSFINKTENYKKHLIIQFRDIKNEIKFIEHKWKMKGLDIFEEKDIETTVMAKERKRFQYLVNAKEKTKRELINYKNTYSCIDEIFTREIKNAENMNNSWLRLIVGCFLRPKKLVYKYDNVVVNECLKQVFMDE